MTGDGRSLPRYFEDLVVGTTFELGEKAVSAEEIISFGRQWDPQTFHVDPVRATDGPFGGLVASGMHTFAVFGRLMADALVDDLLNLGGAGADDVRWLVPVRPGDTLRGRVTVSPETRPSRTKRDRGIVVFRGELENQHSELVWQGSMRMIVGRRPN